MGAAPHSHFDVYDDAVSHHAWQRLNGRGLSLGAIRRVIGFGRIMYVRGAVIYAVGRKEIERFAPDGIDLSDLEGIQVVCSDSGVIMTVYRNRDFRGLRPRRRPHRNRRSR